MNGLFLFSRHYIRQVANRRQTAVKRIGIISGERGGDDTPHGTFHVRQAETGRAAGTTQ